MMLNLNNPDELTLDGVRELIASKDDSRHRQLRVTKDGMAYLSDMVGNADTEGLAFRFETWDGGNDYVGLAASQDEAWIGRIFAALKNNWPNPTDTYLDNY